MLLFCFAQMMRPLPGWPLRAANTLHCTDRCRYRKAQFLGARTACPQCSVHATHYAGSAGDECMYMVHTHTFSLLHAQPHSLLCATSMIHPPTQHPVSPLPPARSRHQHACMRECVAAAAAAAAACQDAPSILFQHLLRPTTNQTHGTISLKRAEQATAVAGLARPVG